MRIDKYLATSGIGSRKEVKILCRKQRVAVNGEIVRDSDADIDEYYDTVTVDGRPVVWQAHHYYMLYKPAGVVSSTREGKSVTVQDILAGATLGGQPVDISAQLPVVCARNLSPVGRLDKDTTGLLILTDDGPLIHELLSPKKHVEKEYIAVLRERISDADMKHLEQGVDIGDEEPTLPAKVFRLKVGTVLSGGRTYGQTDSTEVGTAATAASLSGGRTSAQLSTGEKTGGGTDEIHIVLHEGRFHQVKRMLEAVGNEVLALKRIRMGNLWLDGKLREGEYRELTEEDMELLKGSRREMDDLTDRQVYETSIGPVCMSKREYADYLDALEMKKK